MKRNKPFVDKKDLLYLVATPIGNLNDFNLRAKEIISSSDLVACEDTRNTGFLLSKFNISKPLISLHEHNESSQSEEIIKRIKKDHIKVCYVSDAGYPGISDPGEILVKKCLENDINISVIPGPSAFLNALVGSSIDTSHFLFYGFLDARVSRAEKQLLEIKTLPFTLIFYESPHRIKKTIDLMLKVFGDRKACLVREISKINEEYIYGTLKELSEIEETTLKGEMVLVIDKYVFVNDENEINEEEILKTIKEHLKQGKSKKEITNEMVNNLKINKKIIYKMFSKLEK